MFVCVFELKRCLCNHRPKVNQHLLFNGNIFPHERKRFCRELCVRMRVWQFVCACAFWFCINFTYSSTNIIEQVVCLSHGKLCVTFMCTLISVLVCLDCGFIETNAFPNALVYLRRVMSSQTQSSV